MRLDEDIVDEDMWVEKISIVEVDTANVTDRCEDSLAEAEYSETDIDPIDIFKTILEVTEDDKIRCQKHPHGGYYWEPDLEEKDKDSKQPDNPYHPWANTNELWICDLLFKKAQISISIADEILGAISSSRLCTKEPIRFKNSQEIYQIIDQAEANMVSCLSICSKLF